VAAIPDLVQQVTFVTSLRSNPARVWSAKPFWFGKWTLSEGPHDHQGGPVLLTNAFWRKSTKEGVLAG